MHNRDLDPPESDDVTIRIFNVTAIADPETFAEWGHVSRDPGCPFLCDGLHRLALSWTDGAVFKYRFVILGQRILG